MGVDGDVVVLGNLRDFADRGVRILILFGGEDHDVVVGGFKHR